MIYKTFRSTENFWGKPVSSDEFEVSESYDGEIFDKIKEGIESGDFDAIPDTLDIEANSGCDWCDDSREFEIDVSEFLTESDYTELNKLLEGVE